MRGPECGQTGKVAVEGMLRIKFVVRPGPGGAEQGRGAEVRRLRGEHALAGLHVVAEPADHALFIPCRDHRLAAREVEERVPQLRQRKQPGRIRLRIKLLEKVPEPALVVIAQNVGRLRAVLS